MFEILPRCDYQIGGVYVVALWKGGPYMGLSILNRYPKIKFFGMYVHTYGQTVLYRKHIYIIEGSLEVKLPTIWTDEKQSREEED